ncbi:unnamed protein product [Schistosoma rodhaini]|uniref:Uncharacterized protein n=1 Tax=Schistosoma rodhaini TaxID=6188 RepID=A0AA85GEU6_9TREM|nr:unnamed protein product [Schistosoma rodhaini]
MNTIVKYYLIILFIITTIEIQNIRSAFKKRPPTSFLVMENLTSTERFKKLFYHCFTSFSTWMVLLG